MLDVKNINIYYGHLQALWDASFEVKAKEFVTILGSNGAGKTTLLKAISGLSKPATGTIHFKDIRIDGLEPHRICQMGLIHIPQGRMIFPMMKVIENLEMGAYLPTPRRNKKQNLEQVFSIYPILKQRSGQLAGTLSGGEQQMLAIGRGLMSQPELLILDEPSLGLSPKLALEMYSSLRQLHNQGITILLISQEVLQGLQLSERAYVLENGRVVLQGMSGELLENQAIKKSYLGL